MRAIGSGAELELVRVSSAESSSTITMWMSGVYSCKAGEAGIVGAVGDDQWSVIDEEVVAWCVTELYWRVG